MKPHERAIRDEIARGEPFTLVTSSGDRIKVRSLSALEFAGRSLGARTWVGKSASAIGVRKSVVGQKSA